MFPDDIQVRPHAAPNWLHPIIKPRHKRAIEGVGEPDPRTMTKRAAVLMLFSGDATAETLPDDAGVLLTHRTPTMRTHSGQMAFPGGRIDPEDRGPVEAALREANEETGLDPATVHPVATMGLVSVRSNGYPVHPVIGYSDSHPQTWPASKDETDDVFVAAIEELLEPDRRITVGWHDWTGPAFKINGYLVWGFTASLLSSVFATSGWEKEWDRERVHELTDVLARSRNGERHG
ncbi:CoA pyrophosphatase [Corynebacterium breve]|uniref:CoA pyrophosphatase n=1 Tax=Corynebacterium breve TaxID=3049799 RepID=A0ABY8VFP6_9CORY|nr:CoA pyrophosphatase [Corynebacterium breve]WIM67937.1 CoA pyrophosphatase [Corynebacterium breve]